ncbi:MAG: hypothetical protein HWE27_18355 [Gammaproteobacteria bacterium]|nr:hypothetical protein [Gammaproteobacteria bacterium]
MAMKLYFSRHLGWALLLIIFCFIFFVIWSYPNQKARKTQYAKMLGVSSNALQQGIIYSHLKYHSLSDGTGAKLDLLKMGNSLVDFNQFGFPIGNSHTEDSLKLGITTAHCRELWDDLLQPMRPMITPEPRASLSVKAIQGKCVFTSLDYGNMAIEYKPASGSVQLQVYD